MTPEPQPSPYAAPQPMPQPYGQNPWGQPLPPPGWPTGPKGWGPPPAASRRPWKVVVPVVLVAGVLLFAGCATLVVKGFGSVKSATDDANEYARLLVAGRYDDAYTMHCAADRAQMTAEQFASLYDEAYAGYRIESVNLRNMNGVSSGELRLRLERVGGGPDRHLYLPLRNEGGSWRPCESA